LHAYQVGSWHDADRQNQRKKREAAVGVRPKIGLGRTRTGGHMLGNGDIHVPHVASWVKRRGRKEQTKITSLAAALKVQILGEQGNPVLKPCPQHCFNCG